MVILHEMAHMWFGDLVTMKWWDDLWLNESFAEFCGTLASAEATRFTDAWTTFSSGRKTWGYMQDQLPSTHPVAADVPTLSQAVANFDGISYAKGASVLRQLAAYVGRRAFFAGIRAYFAEHAWGNATLADLLAALEAQLAARAWRTGPGPGWRPPARTRCAARFDVDAGGAFTSFAVVQEAPAAHPTLRPHHLAVGLYRHVDGALARVHRQEVDVAGARTEVPELAGSRAARPDPAQRRRSRLRDRPLRPAVDADADRVRSAAAQRLAGPRGVLERGHRHAAPGRAVAARVRADAGRRHGPGDLGLGAADPAFGDRPGDARWPATRGGCPRARPSWPRPGSGCCAPAEPGSDHQLAWAQLLGWTAATPEQLDLLDRAARRRRRGARPGRGRRAALGHAAPAGRDRAGRRRRDRRRAGAGRHRRRAAARHRLPRRDTGRRAQGGRLAAAGRDRGARACWARPKARAASSSPSTPACSRRTPSVTSRSCRGSGHHAASTSGSSSARCCSRTRRRRRSCSSGSTRSSPPGSDPGLVRVLTERRDIVARALRSRAWPAFPG